MKAAFSPPQHISTTKTPTLEGTAGWLTETRPRSTPPTAALLLTPPPQLGKAGVACLSFKGWIQFRKLWDSNQGIANSFCYQNKNLEKLSKPAFHGSSHRKVKCLNTCKDLKGFL